MTIFSVYIINKAGGLIYQYDHSSARPEVEKTFSYPLEIVLKTHDDKLVVAFGERDGIKGMTRTSRLGVLYTQNCMGNTEFTTLTFNTFLVISRLCLHVAVYQRI